MDIDKFYKALDSEIPGGVLPELDQSIVPNRNLYLTRISMDGLEQMHEYSKDARLYRHFEFEPFQSIEETGAYLKKLLARMGEKIEGRKNMYWFIRLIDNHKIIGSIGLVDIDTSRESASWGYAISPEYWGRGYILEAQLIVVKYSFEVLKLNRLWGVTSVDNLPTISSVTAAGFQKEGILRDYYRFANGEKKDSYLYSMLASDYQKLRLQGKQTGRAALLTLEKLRQIFAEVLNVPAAKIDNRSDIRNVSEWDSLNHVVLIAAIEKETGLNFKPAEIARALSVKAILELVNDR